MAIGHLTEWRKLPVSLAELCINTTLQCGQTFRWRKSAEDEWSCALHGRILSLRQDSEHLFYRSYHPTPIDAAQDDSEALIRHYFNLDVNLSELYEQWAKADANFRKKAPRFTGIRILRQDAWETLVCFICSSNNNIPRISKMIENLCINFGPLIGHIGDTPYHDFPTPSALDGEGMEARLRDLGFGYRALYIWMTAMQVTSHDQGWLDTLRNPKCPPFGRKSTAGKGKLAKGKDHPLTHETEGTVGEGRIGYWQAQTALTLLHGVGPKVADCVCLMGLGWGEAVPVDTHVWQIARRDYGFSRGRMERKTLTKGTYDDVGDHFRKLWGKEAGWAHSVLFTADLKRFSDRLTVKREVEEKVEDSTVNGDDPKSVVKTESLTRLTDHVSVKRELDDENETNPVLGSAGPPSPRPRRSKRRKP